MADPKIKVPANLIPTIQDAANYYGIPFSVLAATIQLGTSWTNNVDDQFVADVANSMAQNAVLSNTSPDSQERVGADRDWLDVAAKTFGGEARNQFRSRLSGLVQEDATDLTDADRWTYDKENPAPQGSYVRPRFGPVGGNKVVIGGVGAQKYPNRAADIDDVGGLFQNLLGRPPKNDAEAAGYVGRSIASVAYALEHSSEGAQWREFGDQITQARRWADSTSMSLTGRPLTNDELKSVVQNGWTPDQLEGYLRAQKYGNTDTTIGQAYDVRHAIMNAFAKAGLPDPTEGQINFALVNHIPAADADAYAEQTKSKTVWATDPTTFTTARRAIQQIMSSYGIVVAEKDIDANLVNQAASGKWTADQMKQAIGSGQMPGAPAGATVDHYTTTKDMADQVWKTYFPTQTMPTSYINQFLNSTPDQITAFIRALPSPEAKAAGVVVPVGAYTDAKNIASQQLAKLGVVGRDPTPQEVASFSTGKIDAEAIAKHYATDPGVLAINPGAQYGLTREAYSRDRSATEAAYGERFGGVSKETLATDAEKAANPTPGPAAAEPDWLKEVFKEGYTPAQSSQMFDTYFRNRGSAPSAAEVDAYQTRSTTVYGAGRTAQPATATTTAGPTQAELGDQDTQKRGFA